MNLSLTGLVLLGALALAVPAVAPRAARAQVRVFEGDSLHPRIRFADSLLSMNDRCPVTGQKLNTRIPPVYVNGRPIGFC